MSERRPMTRADALRALLEKVKAVEASGRFGPLLDGHFDIAVTVDAMRAYNGSIDAAKALHEAVLPGWDWGRSAASGQFYVWNTGEGPASAMSNNEDPARAWLICILKALIATEDN